MNLRTWLIASLVLLAPAARAAERIQSFDSVIAMSRSGTLQVTETIRVHAEGRQIRRGIYRDFPTIYPRADGGRVIVGFAFDAATRDGAPETWRIENRSNGVRIYLGSASRALTTGEHVYELRYRTDRQIGYFADHDELYWNVTGNGWGFDIDRASARVVLPDEIPRSDIRLEAYTGRQGAKGQAFTATLEAGAPLFTTTKGLKPGEGLTIVALWPKGYITEALESGEPLVSRDTSPGFDEKRDAGRTGGGESDDAPSPWGSPAEAFLKRELPHDERPVTFALIGFALLIGYYYFIWNRVGRDPPGRVIIPEYEIPIGQSPASMRYLLRMGYDNECFAAAILSLAVKGCLRIEQSSGVLGFGKTFTLLRESSASADALTADEAKLLAKLFEGGDALELEQKNHRRVRGARSSHESVLERDFKRGFFAINGGWHFLGILLSLAVLAVSLTQPGDAPFWPHWYLTTPLGWITIVAAVAALVANGVFGRLLKAPTVVGQSALDHIRGFRMYLEVAEADELKRMEKPAPKLTPQLFQSYLPAALALDVEQKWAERFARELEVDPESYRPGWYAGPAWNAASIGGFSSQLGSSLSGAIASSSTPPGSKSGGGGGGSSGGGGGGGGGGGW